MRENVKLRDIPKMLWNIVFPMAVHYLCMALVSFVVLTLAGTLSGYVGVNYAMVIAKFPWLTSITSAATAVAAVLVLRRYYRVDEIRYPMEPRKMRAGTRVGLYAAVIAGSAAIGFLLNRLIELSRLGEIFTGYKAISSSSFENQNVVVLVVCVGILASIGEEVVFRGMVYRRVRSYFGVLPAILLSAALFGIYHGNVLQFVYAFFMGLLFAALYEKTGSIYAPIAAHVSANVFSILYPYVQYLMR